MRSLLNASLNATTANLLETGAICCRVLSISSFQVVCGHGLALLFSTLSRTPPVSPARYLSLYAPQLHFNRRDFIFIGPL